MPKPAFWLRPVGALVTGLCCAALVPPWNLGFLIWLCMVPLLAGLWSLAGKRMGLKGFALGWLAGTVAHVIQLSWLSEVSLLGAALLPVYLGLFWGVFGAFAATWGNPAKTGGSISSGLGIAFTNAAIWAVLEWLRGWLLTGFGWNGIGIGFHSNTVFAQGADVLGVAGLSLFLVFIQALLLLAIRQRETKLLIPVAAAVLFAGGYGKIRLSREAKLPTIPLRALLVQNNIPQEAARYLWDPAEIHMSYENATLTALESARAADTFPDWVIWPESALTGHIMRADDGTWGTWQQNVDTLRIIRDGGEFTLMFGVLETEANKDGDQLIDKTGAETYNSLAVLSSEGALQTFRKHHLVIFGETIPFVDSIPFLKKIYEQQAGVQYGGSLAAGKSFDPLSAKTAAGDEISIIPTVCFEDTVPRLPQRFLRDKPQVIVNITNDGWFRESPAAAQHFANSRFRTIELRRPMLRAANTGVTASIDSTGRAQLLTDSKGNHFTSGTLLTTSAIPRHPSFSLYGLIGDWGIITAGGACFLASFITHKKKAKTLHS